MGQSLRSKSRFFEKEIQKLRAKMNFVTKIILKHISILLIFSTLSLSQPEVFEMERVFQLPDIEENYYISTVLKCDLDEDGIDELICKIRDRNQHSKLGIFQNNDWIFYSDRMQGYIKKLVICDFNSDGHKDIVFSNVLAVHQAFWVCLGPNFEETIENRYYFFWRDVLAGGDRILENDETVPFFVLTWPGNQKDSDENGMGHMEAYHYRTIWESSWRDDYPRKVCGICEPRSFVVRSSEHNGNEYFTAGYLKYEYFFLNEINNPEIREEGDDVLFLLNSSHCRPFDQPDSLLIARYPERDPDSGIFHGFRIKFCRYSAVNDFNNDGRLEWAQAHWERIGVERNFNIHLGVYYPDSMVFAREFTDTLNNPYFVDNIGPNFTKGTAVVDVDGDGQKEILFAIQNKPIYIIDSQTMEVMMQSNIRVHNDYFWGFEVGHFDDSGRLQVMMQNAYNWEIFNLPEGWED